jgi:hypothetical protein
MFSHPDGYDSMAGSIFTEFRSMWVWKGVFLEDDMVDFVGWGAYADPVSSFSIFM